MEIEGRKLGQYLEAQRIIAFQRYDLRTACFPLGYDQWSIYLSVQLQPERNTPKRRTNQTLKEIYYSLISKGLPLNGF